jgi:hypothetical protein
MPFRSFWSRFAFLSARTEKRGLFVHEVPALKYPAALWRVIVFGGVSLNVGNHGGRIRLLACDESAVVKCEEHYSFSFLRSA